MNVFFNSRYFRSLKLLVLILVPFLISCNRHKPDPNKLYYNIAYKDAIKESRELLRKYFFTSFIPGMSISVSIDDEIVWSEGIGQASKELNVPATRSTKYRIGTSTGLITNYIVALLHQQGQIDIDSSFYNYVPNFPQKQYDFTPRMLGAHTSGFRNYPFDQLLQVDSITSLKSFIHFFDEAPLLFKPNDFFETSVYNTGLLAILAEQVTGKKYSKLVTEMLKDTLKLNSLSFDHPVSIVENRSEFYDLDYIARVCNAKEINLYPFAAISGALLTADDLNHLAAAVLEPGIFNEETIKLLTKKQVVNSDKEINHSFGWMVFNDNKDRELLARLGDIKGGSSAVVVYPEQKLVVTITANNSNKSTELPANQIAQTFIKYMEAE